MTQDKATSWADQTMLAFDTETTGPDPLTARIVTATATMITPGGAITTTDWLADPGIEIPVEATAVHGITTEHAREHGRPAAEVIAEIRRVLEWYWAEGIPVVAFNANYDLTVVGRECARHDLPPFVVAGPVIDPLVIDRHIDPYRRGKRRLADVCTHYGVSLDRAHSSAADALAAARVAWKIAQRHPEVGTLELRALHQQQAQWHASWAEGFESWLRDAKRRDGASEAELNAVVVEREWPVRGAVGAQR